MLKAKETHKDYRLVTTTYVQNTFHPEHLRRGVILFKKHSIMVWLSSRDRDRCWMQRSPVRSSGTRWWFEENNLPGLYHIYVLIIVIIVKWLGVQDLWKEERVTTSCMWWALLVNPTRFTPKSPCRRRVILSKLFPPNIMAELYTIRSSSVRITETMVSVRLGRSTKGFPVSRSNFSRPITKLSWMVYKWDTPLKPRRRRFTDKRTRRILSAVGQVIGPFWRFL